ncbi:hypothetical protein ACWCOW_39550 [Streptomyces sp. NPDC001939]
MERRRKFAFASTYNSGGTPADMEGTNLVTSGGQCLQAKEADVERQLAPVRRCPSGRADLKRRSVAATMLVWVNSTSMSSFPTSAKQLRLLEEDLYL